MCTVLHTVSTIESSATQSTVSGICFDQVHFDIIGPLAFSKRYSYHLNCIDHFTCWLEAMPIVDITTETTACAFVSGWVAHFGVPSTVITDCGQQFESALWQQLMELLGTKHIYRSTHIIPLQMASLNGFNISSRQPSKHVHLRATGQSLCLWHCFVHRQH